jgi:cyclopropane-fatty-acyl-phospholipid synthase
VLFDAVKICKNSRMPEKAKDLGKRLLDAAGVPINSSEPWSLHVHDERLWDRAVAEQQLGLGEAYLDGWWDCERLDVLLTKVLDYDIQKQLRLGPKIVATAAKSWVLNRQTKARATNNARHHYDIGNDLYERMLDKRMVYSCGYWASAQNLDDAQEAKLDLICRKLHLEKGMTLLDIGCGWGGLLQFAAEHYGVTGVGISPAINQVDLARERCSGLPITIHQMDYRDLTGSFDRIVSVGMMEHVGPKNLKTFFQTCDRLLADDGMMLHHTIGSLISKQHTDAFFDKYIFPGGVLPSLAQFSKSAESHWVIEDVHNFGPDYDKTLLAWNENISSRWSEIPQYDERFQRMWHYYLMASAAGFRARSLQLWQIVMRRKGVADRYQPVR